MKIILRYIFLITLAGILFHSVSSCNKENPTEPGNIDIGILRTDELGNILGGDYSDWCIHSPVDTFTYIRTFTITTPQSNISRLKWTTSREYHCYGFDVERRTTSDTNYLKIGFVNGTGTTNDSVSYVYTDTLLPNHPNYLYRLKQLDIYGNYIYQYSGVQNIYPVSNAFFGPAFPNPVTTSFKIKFQIPRVDTISIYFAEAADTLFILNKECLMQGMYEIQTSNSANFQNIQKRLYIKSSSIQNSDSCRLYGDIQFK